jgi:hypothetical protein
LFFTQTFSHLQTYIELRVRARLLKIAEKVKEKRKHEFVGRLVSDLRGIVLPWGVCSSMVRFMQVTPSEFVVRGESV